MQLGRSVHSRPGQIASPFCRHQRHFLRQVPLCAAHSPSTPLRAASFPSIQPQVSLADLKSFLEAAEPPNGHVATQLAATLGTDLQNGLETSLADLKQRRKDYGSNRLAPLPPISFLAIFLDALDDFTILILIASGVLSLILEYSVAPGGDYGWLEGTAILLSVTVVVLVTSITNLQKEIKFRELSALNEDIQVRVMRDGREQEISCFDLVVGDILMVEGGDILPADGILVDGCTLSVDESHLTGEADECVKSPNCDCVVYSGSKVNEGVGRVLVLAVGMQSKQGSIAALASGRDALPFESLQGNSALRQTTVLTAKLETLAADIGRFGLGAALVTLVAMSSQFSYQTFFVEHQPWDWKLLEVYLHQLITSITVLVVAVPEGLPLASTLALAFSIQRMMADNNLVRHLDACETMGSVTTVCTDKTGTLTQNDLTVQELWTGGQRWKAGEADLSDPVRQIISEAISLNTTASLETQSAPGEVGCIGNRTECGLLKFVNGPLRSDFQSLRRGMNCVRVFPFTSLRKRMGVLMKHPSSTTAIFHLKGAPEIILSLCKYKLDADGQKVALTETERSELRPELNSSFSALRTLAFAFREVPLSENSSAAPSLEELEQDLTFIGIIGLSDYIRSEAPFAIQQCQRAGVAVKMLTGDNAETAGQIAQTCHILEDPLSQGAVIEGPEFRSRVIQGDNQLNVEAFEEIWSKLKVMARCSPEDKYLLVRGIQSIGNQGRREIIAMTGDGTNDAPALRIADVGFAMASGTPIAREASDILLLDDSFQSIVSAMKWGRNVFSSVTKFLQFQLTVNIVAMITACTGAIWLQQSPLSAVQMLWVNLIMDSLASLSLATEAPSDAVLDLPPNLSDAPILSPLILKNITGQSLYQLGVMYVLIFHGDLIQADSDQLHQFTLVFNSFVCMQLFNQINARKISNEADLLEGMFANRLFFTIWSAEWVLQYLIVEYGGSAFQTSPLDFREWLICLGFGALSLPLREAIRQIKRF